MRAHEVPTHVQAEDRVLLWLTFPQIVAMTAVCALAYGLYQYAPLGPAGRAHRGGAVLFGLTGFAVVAGRVNGRRLPLVAADLLRYALGARRYAGPPSELVRCEPPPPPPGGETAPLRLLARRMLRRTRRAARKRKDGERRTGRLPFRPQRLFGRRRGGEDPDGAPAAREDREQRLGQQRRGKRGFWKSFLAAAVLALVMLATLPLDGGACPGQPGRRRAGPPRRSSSSPRPRSPEGGSSSRASRSAASGPRLSCGRPWTCGSRYASTAAPGAACLATTPWPRSMRASG